MELPIRERTEGRIINVAIGARVRENPVRFGILEPNGGEYIHEVEIAENARDEAVNFTVRGDISAWITNGTHRGGGK